MTQILTWLKAKLREWAAPDYSANWVELLRVRGDVVRLNEELHRVNALAERQAEKLYVTRDELKKARRPQWHAEFADDAPKWEREHSEAWKVFLGQTPAGQTLRRVGNYLEQQTNRSAVHRTTGTEQNVGYARGWHDATHYFFKTLSADPQPQSGTDTQATNEADVLRERLASS